MLNISMEKLIEKLSPLLKLTLEEAAQLAISQAHFNVEIEHWFISILKHPHADLLELIKKYESFDEEKFIHEISLSIESFQSGNARPPAFSKSLLEILNDAWLLSSVEFERQDITSAHLLLSVIRHGGICHQIGSSVPSIFALNDARLLDLAKKVVGATSESVIADTKMHKGPMPSASGIEKFAEDLTQKARDGKIDPVVGRDDEVRQLIDVLLRRRQNNPILTGEPGVGKTAVVEGLANRIVSDDVPDPLKGIRLISLDLAALQAGASVKGEFEKRLKSFIEEVKASETPIIVFIDEAHTLIGAGGSEGKGDAANLLKPALARGEFRTIAATTWAEYKKYFEKDPALARRFQVVKVEEPSIPVAIDMMRAIAKSLEMHHGIRIMDEAIEASVNLASRYIPSRQLPDKSISLLDTACARVALSQGATPASIERAQRIISQCDTNLKLLKDEQTALGGCEDKIAHYLAIKEQTEVELAGLSERWLKEQDSIRTITGYREQGKSLADYQADVEQLKTLQGEQPMIYLDVTAQSVAEVVENWTGIPVGNLVADEIQSLLTLEDKLKERVVGQDHAMAQIAQAIRISRSGLTDPRKPVGVFMMVGTSGTGKTETALALADYLYGGEQNLITINMSEFKEEHKISMLLGASAGYVGYGEGGVLTEAVRKNPHSVVLLDEMEKAHPGIQDVFYNLFDKGTIKDGEGQDIDFKNTLIIMTTNAATHAISQYFGKTDLDEGELLEAIRPELLEDFRPAFLGRCTIVPYFPLSKDVLRMIVGINLKRIEKRLKDTYKATFEYDENVMNYLLEKCNDPDTGARNAENVINKSLLPAVSNACLEALAKGVEISSVEVLLDNGAFVAEAR